MTEPTIFADTDTAIANVHTVLQFFSTALGPAHVTAGVSELLAPDFVDHDAAGPDSGPESVVAKLAGLWQALPTGEFVPLEVVAAGDRVTVRSRLHAAATRTTPAIAVDFADSYRVHDGRISEHWHVTDGSELARQLAARG